MIFEVNNMTLKSIVDKFKGEDSYVEVEQQEEHKEEKQLWIEIEKLDSFTDSDRIQRKVREGNILLVRIRDLRAKDMEELKRSVERIRRTCLAVNGDIAGLGDDWLIVTPATAKVFREQQSE
jgi:hypothetical protein